MLIQNCVRPDSIIASQLLLVEFCNTIGTYRKSRLLSVWSVFGPKSDSLTRLMSHARQVRSSNRGLVHCNLDRWQKSAPFGGPSPPRQRLPELAPQPAPQISTVQRPP